LLSTWFATLLIYKPQSRFRFGVELGLGIGVRFRLKVCIGGVCRGLLDTFFHLLFVVSSVFIYGSWLWLSGSQVHKWEGKLVRLMCCDFRRNEKEKQSKEGGKKYRHHPAGVFLVLSLLLLMDGHGYGVCLLFYAQRTNGAGLGRL